MYNDISDKNLFIAYKNPFRYRSYYYDFETNLYYLNSRYYDPETGRFINADDIGTLDITHIALNGLNLYAYCLDNPVNEVDESGYFLWWLLVAILIGATIGGTTNGIKAYNEGARGWGLFGSIAGGAIMGGAMGGLLAFGGGLAVGVIGSFTLPLAGALSAGIGILAGWSSYSIESLLREDMSWNLTSFGKAGISGLTKGLSTFSIGYLGGKFLGSHDKLLLKPLLKGAPDYNTTYNLAKVIMGRKAFLSPIGEVFLKSILIGGFAAGTRKFIDWIFGK